MSKERNRGLNGLSQLKEMRLLADQGVAPNDPEMEAKYPLLFSLLSDTKVSDLERVDPPRLSLSNNSGSWVLGLAVSSLGMYREVSAVTLVAALALMEQSLASDPKGWRVNNKKRMKIRTLPTAKPSS